LEVYKRDVAPLHCKVRRRTWSGYVVISEWGRINKGDPDVALATGDFDTLSGKWTGKQTFDLKRSFLNASFQGKAQSIVDVDWADPSGWLVKCDQIVFRSNDSEVQGDNDRLCWRQCGKTPCWLQASDMEEAKKLANETAAKDDDVSEEANALLEEDEPDSKPVLFKKFNVAAWGCRQMRSTVLIAMVLMQMFMLFGLANHEFALPRLFDNKLFPFAWVVILFFLGLYVYLPVSILDQGVAPLGSLGVCTAVLVAVTFYILLEVAKAVFRAYFILELLERTAVAQLHAEGRLRAFCSREEAFAKCPERQPLVYSDSGSPQQGSILRGYGSVKDDDYLAYKV